MKYLAFLTLLLATLIAPATSPAQPAPSSDGDEEPRTLATVGSGENVRSRDAEKRREDGVRDKPIESLVKGEASHGTFGGPSLKLSDVDGDLAMFLGARGGWIIDHTITLGLAGYLSINDIQARQRFGSTRAVVNFDYGGVFGEYTIATNDLVHVTLDLFGGAGRASYGPEVGTDPDAIPDEHTSVFVGEASVNGELNITKNLRMTLGGGYRHVDGPSLYELSSQDLSGFTATATFKVGIF